MNKKGFTLIELLAVITLIALISIIAIPKITNNFVNKKIELSNANQELLAAATDTYIENNQSVYSNNYEANGSVYCIPVQMLVDSGMLETPFKDISGKEIDYSNNIKATYQAEYNSFDYELVKKNECTELIQYVSRPQLEENMIPVIYNEESNSWVKADKNSHWYNYSEKKWANAVVVNEYKSTEQNSKSRYEYAIAPSGTPILESDILGYFVWIPRFRYQLFESNTPQDITIVFENSSTKKSAGNTKNQWLTHPAFTYKNKELSGIWIGKYETSNQNDKPVIKNETAWTNIEFKEANINSTSMIYKENIYGFKNVNTHIIRNSEWAALAYLTNSIYGNLSENSTTGNNTGIYNLSGNKEFVSIDNEDENSLGYALNETKNWTTENSYTTEEKKYLARGKNSIFNYTGESAGSSTTTYRIALVNTDAQEPLLAEKEEPCFDGISDINGYIDFTYTGDVQTFEACKGRIYKLEVWGAQGGSYSSTYYGGKGGYSVGTISLAEEKTIYVYVGQQPTNHSTSSNATNKGGYNGGGNGKSYSYDGTSTYSLGGGGATDMRIDANQDDNATLYERIIVAGGGSGSSNIGSGYAGGGLNGLGYNTSYAGTQTSAGTNGSFGQGGNAKASYNYKYGPGGGGGGWYGGGQITSSSDSSTYYAYATGGGSGYVYTSETASNYPSECLLNSSYYLTNAKTIAGNTSFTSPTGTSEKGHTGNGFARITYIGNKKENNNTPVETCNDGISSKNGYIDFAYTGDVQTFESCKGRKYKLEVWGAQGGTNPSNQNGTGGLGGYSSGTIEFNNKENLYIYVGGAGSYGSATAGGFNGGGIRTGQKTNTTNDAGGGGASDIRIGTDSLYARVIVAGGGGGGGHATSGTANGGYGGGTSGGIGTGSAENHGVGGTQTMAGLYPGGNDSEQAGFGLGSGGPNGTVGGGGGGGWYGGSFGTRTNGGGGGGSGYVYTSETAANYPSGCLLNSEYYLTNASTVAGNTSFTSPTGTSETGHSGNGFARITYID